MHTNLHHVIACSFTNSDQMAIVAKRIVIVKVSLSKFVLSEYYNNKLRKMSHRDCIWFFHPLNKFYVCCIFLMSRFQQYYIALQLLHVTFSAILSRITIVAR